MDSYSNEVSLINWEYRHFVWSLWTMHFWCITWVFIIWVWLEALCTKYPNSSYILVCFDCLVDHSFLESEDSILIQETFIENMLMDRFRNFNSVLVKRIVQSQRPRIWCLNQWKPTRTMAFPEFCCISETVRWVHQIQMTTKPKVDVQ